MGFTKETARQAALKSGPRGPGKLTKTVKETVLEVFNQLQEKPGVKLLDWAQEEPTEFYKIAAKLIPAELNATVKADMVINWHEERTYETNDQTDTMPSLP